MARIRLVIHVRPVEASADAAQTVPPDHVTSRLVLAPPAPIRFLLGRPDGIDHAGDGSVSELRETVEALLGESDDGSDLWSLSTGDPWTVDPITGRWIPPTGTPTAAVFVLLRNNARYRHDLYLDEGHVSVEYEIGAELQA